MIIVWKSIVIV